MKPMPHSGWTFFWMSLATFCSPASGVEPRTVGSPAVRPWQQVEADWLRQEQVRRRGTPRGRSPRRKTRSAAATASRTANESATTAFIPTSRRTRGGRSIWAARCGWTGRDLQRQHAGRRPAGAGHLRVLLSGRRQDMEGGLSARRLDVLRPAAAADRAAGGAEARYVRVQLPYAEYLHLDEIEVYRGRRTRNVALHRPATQSSVSQWSRRESRAGVGGRRAYPVATDARRGRKLAGGHAAARGRRSWPARPAAVAPRSMPTRAGILGGCRPAYTADEIARRGPLPPSPLGGPANGLGQPAARFPRPAVRQAGPNLLLCHCDEYLSWFSRPGGELFVLEDFAGPAAAAALPDGRASCRRAIVRPDLSYDGRKVLFAYCQHYPGLWQKPNKLDKASIPEDAFYHLYEMNLDGTGLRRLTHGKYDDFDGRYLPDGEIVFLSTRRGQFVQCGQASAAAERQAATAGLLRPLRRRAGAAGGRLHAARDGRRRRPDAAHLAVREFRVDPQRRRPTAGSCTPAGITSTAINMPLHEALVHACPTAPTPRPCSATSRPRPHCMFEARSIPGSHKLIFTGVRPSLASPAAVWCCWIRPRAWTARRR